MRGKCRVLLIITLLTGLCGVGYSQDVELHKSAHNSYGGSVLTGPEDINFGWFLKNGNLLTVGNHVPPRTGGMERQMHDPYLISLWDPQTGARLAVASHERDIEDAEVSPDGRYLAAWEMNRTDTQVDGAIRLFDVYSADHNFGKQVAVLGGPTRSIADVEFSPDSRFVAVAYNDFDRGEETTGVKKAVRVFNRDTATEYGFITMPDRVDEIGFSPDGKYLGVYSTEEVLIWNVLIQKTVGVTKTKSRAKFTADSRLIIVWKENKAAGSGGRYLAYPITNGESDFASPSDFDTSAALQLEKLAKLTGVSQMENYLGDELKITESRTDRVVVKLERTPKPSRPPGVPPTMEYSLENEGVHAISASGSLALVDSQIVDVETKTIRMLDLLPEEDYRPWRIVEEE